MNGLVAGGFVVFAAGVIYVFGGGQRPADVYAMPVSDAYAKLTAVDFGSLSKGEAALDTTKTATGNGSDKVTWTQAGDMARFECAIDLKALPEDRDQTHVTVTCKGGGAGEGAAAGLVHNMRRKAVIERIDATLTGRAYDPKRARGSTAARWPGDGVEGNYVQMAGDALKMEADIKRDIREMEAEEKRRADLR